MRRIRTLAFGVAACALLAFAGTASASQVGQSRTVKDMDGNAARITLVKISANMPASNAYMRPDAGNKFYGVFVRVTNLSNKLVSDCSGNTLTLASKAGDSYDEAFAEVHPALGCYKLLPHRVAQGWIVFEAPKSARPAYLDWTVDSGMGDATADFKLL